MGERVLSSKGLPQTVLSQLMIIKAVSISFPQFI